MATEPKEIIAPSFGGDDLAAFLERLRVEGFPIGIEDHIRAQELATASGRLSAELDPIRLRNWLAPLLCHSAEHQRRFHALFEVWWQAQVRDEITADLPSVSPPEATAGEQDIESSRWLWIMVPVFVVFCTVFLAGLIHEDRKSRWRSTIPELSGLALALAVETAKASNLNPVVVGRVDENAPPGTVVDQDPDPGTLVDPEANVTLWVAEPGLPASIVVRNYVGLDANAATESVLESRLGTPQIERVPSDEAPGTVVRQQPDVGTLGSPDTQIVLWIAEARDRGDLLRVSGRVIDEHGTVVARARVTVVDASMTITDEAVWPHSVHAQFDHTGDSVLISTYYGSVRVWPAHHSEEPLTIWEQPGRVLSAVFDPAGQAIAIASEDNNAYVWRPDDATEVITLSGHEDTVTSAEFSPSGRGVVTASMDGSFRVWNLDAPGEPPVVVSRRESVYYARFDPSGNQVLTVTSDNAVRLWTVSPVAEPIALQRHEAAIYTPSFDESGSRILTASADGTARIWNLQSFAAGPVMRHDRGVRAARFDPSGVFVVTASEDGLARLWRAETGEFLREYPHEAVVNSASFGPNGERIVTASDDGTARIWARDGSSDPLMLEGHQAPVVGASFDTSGRFVLTASDDCSVRIWDAEDGTLQRLLPASCAETRSDDTGHFVLDAKTPQTVYPGKDAAARDYEPQIYVSRPGRGPAGPVTLPLNEPGTVDVEVVLAAEADVWSEIQRRETAISYGLAAFPLLLLVSWLGWQMTARRKVVLERRASKGEELAEYQPPPPPHRLYQGRGVVKARIEARRRISEPSTELDLEATALETTQSLGFFTPVYRSRRRMPAYLVLVDRSSRQDHQASQIEVLIDRLREGGVDLEVYEFDRDPRLCASTTNDRRVQRNLKELAAVHSDYRLLMFSDGSGLTDPVTGRLASWIERFHMWEHRALMTTVPVCLWTSTEAELVAERFHVLPASPDGLLAFVTALQHETVSLADSADWSPPIPEVIQENPDRWLDRRPPDPRELAELVRQLRVYLGQDGYRWLCSLSVYPEIHWHLTLYLGLRILDPDGKHNLNEARLVSLSRLPWLRQGTLPDWLRVRLMRDLSTTDETTIRDFLQDLLRSRQSSQEGLRLELARPQESRGRIPRHWQQYVRELVHTETADGPLRDYVFVEFLLGIRPSKLQLVVPRGWKRWVYHRGWRSLGWRPVSALVVALLVSLTIGVVSGSGFELIRQMARPVDGSRIEIGDWEVTDLGRPDPNGKKLDPEPTPVMLAVPIIRGAHPLRWDPIDGATGYEVSYEALGATPIVATVPAARVESLPGIPDCVKVVARVRALDDTGATLPSQLSRSFSFLPPPVVRDLQPRVVSRDQDFELQISGVNFDADVEVLLTWREGKMPLTVTDSACNTLRVSGSVHTETPDGTLFTVKVTNPDGGTVSLPGPELEGSTTGSPSLSSNCHPLRWNTVPGATSYRLYYGFESGQYDQSIEINQTYRDLAGLAECSRIYLAVTALNQAGESGRSNELGCWPPPRIDRVDPPAVQIGSETLLTVSGVNFDQGVTATFIPGLFEAKVIRTECSEVELRVFPTGAAAAVMSEGPNDNGVELRIINPDGGTATVIVGVSSAVDEPPLSPPNLRRTDG